MVALKHVEGSRAWVGRIVADKYRLLRVIGEGGMGAVFEAEDLTTDRRVAVKWLFPHIVEQSPNARRRFAREARIASEIRDPRIVEIYDVVQDRDGSSYIVMELLSGESLAERLAREETLTLGQSLAILREVLEALASAHAQGIIHRDIKPENIFLSDEGVKLLDFGISKYAGGETNLTATNALVGSPFYMSPEQALAAKDLDHRTDLFSTGAVLFACLTGRVLFAGTTIAKVIARLVTEEPPLLRSVAGDAPYELERAIDRALAPNPAQRYQSAEEMWAALEPFVGSSWRVDSENETQVIAEADRPAVLAPIEGDEETMPSVPVLDTFVRTREPIGLADERYEVRGLLGFGGSCEIYEVFDTVLNRSLALKKPRRDRAGSDADRKLFREAQLTAQLEHPNIMPIYDWGRLVSGEPYFTMKRVEGPTLRSLIESIARGDRGTIRRFDPKRLTRIYRGIFEAVAYAHESGVIHCDLGSSNVLVGDRGEVLVTDWGYAQLIDRRREARVKIDYAARTLNLGGSLAYLSPEQACGDAVDERTDIYALGAIMYEMVTLAPPYAARNRRELVNSIKANAIVRPTVRFPSCEVARIFEPIIMTAMAPDPAERYRDVAALEAALRDAVNRLPANC